MDKARDNSFVESAVSLFLLCCKPLPAVTLEQPVETGACGVWQDRLNAVKEFVQRELSLCSQMQDELFLVLAESGAGTQGAATGILEAMAATPFVNGGHADPILLGRCS